MLSVIRGGRPQGRGGAGGRGEEWGAEGVDGGVARECAALGRRHVSSCTLSIERAGGRRARERVAGSHERRLGLSKVHQGVCVVDTRTRVGGFGVLHCTVERRMTWKRVGIS